MRVKRRIEMILMMRWSMMVVAKMMMIAMVVIMEIAIMVMMIMMFIAMMIMFIIIATMMIIMIITILVMNFCHYGDDDEDCNNEYKEESMMCMILNIVKMIMMISNIVIADCYDGYSTLLAGAMHPPKVESMKRKQKRP